MAVDAQKARDVAAGAGPGEAALQSLSPDKLAMGAEAPIATQSALTTEPAAAPAGGSGATPGAYDTAANRNAMIVTLNDTRTRVKEIEDALKLFGLLA